MAMAYTLSSGLLSKPSRSRRLFLTIGSSAETENRNKSQFQVNNKKKRCLRCNTLYMDQENSSSACSFHGHTTGEKGLFALAPPHQGIDGEWSDQSGVIVYKWNDEKNRPNTGRVNWKKRWSCCQEYDEDAPPCQKGWHVTYDDGFTLRQSCIHYTGMSTDDYNKIDH